MFYDNHGYYGELNDFTNDRCLRFVILFCRIFWKDIMIWCSYQREPQILELQRYVDHVHANIPMLINVSYTRFKSSLIKFYKFMLTSIGKIIEQLSSTKEWIGSLFYQWRLANRFYRWLWGRRNYISLWENRKKWKRSKE